MQVVCSPILSRSDIDLFRRAHLERPSVLRSFDLAKLTLNRADFHENVVGLIATGKLEIRIAVLSDSKHGIYHEKIGVFEDSERNRVAFTGSANETLSGLQRNFEVVDVFRSWDSGELRRVNRKLNDFERLWASETDNIEVMTFPQAAIKGLIRLREQESADPSLDLKSAKNIPGSEFRGLEESLFVPTDLILFDHQKRAVRKWFASGGRGIFEMATGSGKTIAALVTASALYASTGGPLFVLIVCPYLHLVSQWTEIARSFGLDPLQCAVARSKWREELSVALYNLSVGTRRLASAVVTNSTFASQPFRQLIDDLTTPALIIGDEVHNLGAPGLRDALSTRFAYRLGLSATPERNYDQEGTDAIRKYFGESVEKYTIEDALADGVLCPYRYHPTVVELSESEALEYYELTSRIAREAASAEQLESDSRSDILEALLIKRARLIATAESKLPKLRQIMETRRHSRHNLIYCGDGAVDDSTDMTVIRQLDLVTRMLGNDLNMRVSRYVAETPLLRREKLRKDFADGHIQCLVAIRCLDEGVDIPETRCAFILASSTNPRQFIQRRGRVLRRSPGKESAEIFDFIVTPPADMGPAINFNADRQLVRKELSRVITFANNALNGPEALNKLLPVRQKLNLLDVF